MSVRKYSASSASQKLAAWLQLEAGSLVLPEEVLKT